MVIDRHALKIYGTARLAVTALQTAATVLSSAADDVREMHPKLTEAEQECISRMLRIISMELKERAERP